MKIYFLSSKPCALTINGVFYGMTDTFERSAEICLADNVYAQFSPQGAQPIGFFVGDALRTTPPIGCEVYLMPEGIAVYARDFPPVDFSLFPIAQEREGELVATVYKQGVLQLSIQSPSGFFNATLPPSFDECSIEFHHGLVTLKGKNTLGIFNKSAQPLLLEQIIEYSWTEEGLNATLPLFDSLKRVAKCSWKITERECILTEFTLRQPSGDAGANENLLAYAFFESVLLKGNFREFLADELQADVEGILSFLGDFTAVVLTKEPNVCGLVRKKGDRLFQIDHFAVQIQEGKIVDITG